MPAEYYQVKDNCRQALLKHMEKAIILLPEAGNPKILDIGCGTGVPTVWLAENYGGTITAIDTNAGALAWLNSKIIARNLENQITTVNISFFDLKSEPCFYDIILAEGFLNIVGFEQGFVNVTGMLKEGGWFVIHDEYKDHEKKCEFIRENNCDLAGTVYLDERTWWNDYYRQLEAGINSRDIKQVKNLFKAELKEIELYRRDPSPFRSIYYIVKKKLG